jgi:hypothetical protein
MDRQTDNSARFGGSLGFHNGILYDESPNVGQTAAQYHPWLGTQNFSSELNASVGDYQQAGSQRFGFVLPRVSDTTQPSLYRTGISLVENTASAQGAAIMGPPLGIDDARQCNATSGLDWKSNMDRMRKLYLEEDKTLTETMKIMEQEFGFKAS